MHFLSELKAMSVKQFNVGWLVFELHHLSDWVLVELSCSSAKSIRFVFEVIGLQVFNEPRSHVSMIFTWPHTWIQFGA